MKKIFIATVALIASSFAFAQAPATTTPISKNINCKNLNGVPTCLKDAYILDDVSLALMSNTKDDEAKSLFNSILGFDQYSKKSERGFAESRKMTVIMSLDVFGSVPPDDILKQRRIDLVKQLADKKTFVLPIAQLATPVVTETIPNKIESRVVSFAPALDTDRISIGKTETNVCSKKAVGEGFNCIRIKNISDSEKFAANLPENTAKNYFSDLPLARFPGMRAYKIVNRQLNKIQLRLENGNRFLYSLQIDILGPAKQEGANLVFLAVAKKAIIYGPRGAIVGHDLIAE